MNTGEGYAIFRLATYDTDIHMAMSFRTHVSSDQAMIVLRSVCVTLVLTTYVGVCMAN